MLRTLLPVAILSFASAAHAQSAAEQLRLQRYDETHCDWLQAFTDIKIESCTFNKAEMLVIPTRTLSRTQALDLMATAAVAAEMKRRSPLVLSVAFSPSLGRFLRVKGNPVRFNGTENPKAAMRQLDKSAVECRMRNLETQCPGEAPTKPVPIG